jgi:hypothetical protein
MYHFEVAYELIRELRPSLPRDSAHVLRNMGHVLIEQWHFKKALERCNKAKQVLEELKDSCQLEMAVPT